MSVELSAGAVRVVDSVFEGLVEIITSSTAARRERRQLVVDTIAGQTESHTLRRIV